MGVPKSIPMLERVANDWTVLGLANTGQGEGLVGAQWLFSFVSDEARVLCTYGFLGVGVGLGASLLPVDAAKPQGGARIRGWRGFSANDIDGAGGMVVGAGAEAFGAGLGPFAGILKISAFDSHWIPFFSYQSVPGPDSGLGLDASWVEGCWILLSIRDRRTGQFWNALTSNIRKFPNA